jgi:hypothetical protein
MADEEKTASDAPVWYTAEEAAAWAAGYNKAVYEHSGDITGWGDV